MQRAELFLQVKEQFENVRTEYRKMFSKWDKLEREGDIQQADDLWIEMEKLKYKMFDLKAMADKLKVTK